VIKVKFNENIGLLNKGILQDIILSKITYIIASIYIYNLKQSINGWTILDSEKNV